MCRDIDNVAVYITWPLTTGVAQAGTTVPRLSIDDDGHRPCRLCLQLSTTRFQFQNVIYRNETEQLPAIRFPSKTPVPPSVDGCRIK